jgi:predicted nucleotidyltransferase
MKPSLALAAHRTAIRNIVRQHRAANPRVFGSVARGEDNDHSDIDLLVDPAPGMTLFDIGGLIDDLETLLGLKVDVVTPGALPPAMFASILRELKPV